MLLKNKEKEEVKQTSLKPGVFQGTKENWDKCFP